MQSVTDYVRSLLGWGENKPKIKSPFIRSSKRDRNDDDFSSDEDVLIAKKLKTVRQNNYPNIMGIKDNVREISMDDKHEKNIRYIPIQIDPGHSSRKQPVVVIDDEEEDVILLKTTRKPENCKTLYINSDDDDDDKDEVIEIEQPKKDVLVLKKVTVAQPSKSYKLLVNKNSDETTEQLDKVQYNRVKKFKDRQKCESPRAYSKFKANAGITKSYKKVPTTTLPKWISGLSNLSNKNNVNLNGNIRSTLTSLFNLEEKKQYEELIKKVARRTNPMLISKKIDSIDLLDDESIRQTQKTQKHLLNEMKIFEQTFKATKDNEDTEEYEPITIASLNSSDSELDNVCSESSHTSSMKVDRVNTLRESHKKSPVTSRSWLTEIGSKYQKKKEDIVEKVKDVDHEYGIISKVHKEQELAKLQYKLKHELRFPDSILDEVKPIDELPELSEEQEALVKRALESGPLGQCLVEKFGLRIHRRDLKTLENFNWLNDEVINFYMNLLMQRSEERSDLPKVYATNTFFYPKLMQSGQSGLRRWTRKVDIFAHDIMVVPVHLGVHWCLSLIHFRDKKISYLDSMGGRNQACLDALLKYLRDEHQDKKGKPFDDSGWSTENLKDIPQQMNGSDCGMFACTFAEFSCRNAPYTFTQKEMPYLRRKAVLEILQGKLVL